MDRFARRALILSFVLAVFAVLPSRAAHADESASLAGRFHYTGGAAEENGRQAAIDRAIEDMFFAIRPIARYRLNNALRTVQWVSFAFEGNQVHTRGPDNLDVRAPVAGAEVSTVWRGEHTKVRQRVVPHGLVQTWVADEGWSQNEYALSNDGQTLTVKMTISSSHLSKSIVFTQTYRRD